MVSKVIAQEVRHGSGVKSENTGHIGVVKLKIALVEDGGVGLVIHYIYDFTQSPTDIN